MGWATDGDSEGNSGSGGRLNRWRHRRSHVRLEQPRSGQGDWKPAIPPSITRSRRGGRAWGSATLKMRCNPGGAESQSQATTDAPGAAETCRTPLRDRAFGRNCHRLSLAGSTAATERQPAGEFTATANDTCTYDFCQGWHAANALRSGHISCPVLAPSDADLQRVVGAWSGLPKNIRKAIVALVEAVEPATAGTMPRSI